MASMVGEGKCSKSGLWMSGADSTKPLSDRRTRKSRHPMSGCSAGKCNSRSSMDVRMSNASVPPMPSGRRGIRLLATSLYDDPAAELHEDASARLREHLALPGCSILRRSSSGVSGYQDPAGGHEEGAVTNHRERPVSRDTALRISCRIRAAKGYVGRTGGCT